jgi:CubicO group peptidase (beta-lactamase class C family)
MVDLSVPGVALALIEDGQIDWVRHYGVASAVRKNPVTADTLFNIQSVSKAIAGWAVMCLVEDRLASLDAPVETYLKRWSFPPSPYPSIEVTLRRLLSHHGGISTAGIKSVPAEFTDLTLIDGLLADLPDSTEDQKAYYQHWALEPDHPIALEFPPGKEWHYSNGGFALLELMIEDLTGLTYSAFVAKRILTPLGMVHSTFHPADHQDVAAWHGVKGAELGRYRWLSLAAAGLYTTIEDLASFACAEMTGRDGEPAGRKVLSRQSIETMFTAHGLADSAFGIQFHAGLGHLLSDAGGTRNVHHSGGSLGGRSIYSIFPDQRTGFCMLMNSDQANPLWFEAIGLWQEALRAG